MKYLIIPICRIVTLPVVVAISLFALIGYLLVSLWNCNFEPLLWLIEDDGVSDKFWRSDEYRMSGGKVGYCYKTFWHYLVYKKTYGNEKAI